MADPLSIVASAIAIAGAGGTIVKALKLARDRKTVPQDVQRLCDDIEEFDQVIRAVVDAIEKTVGAQHLPFRVLDSIDALLRHARDVLLELNTIVQYKVLTAAGAVNHFGWLQELRDIDKKRRRLATIKLSLTAILSAANSAILTEIHFALRQTNQTLDVLRSHSREHHELTSQTRSDMLDFAASLSLDARGQDVESNTEVGTTMSPSGSTRTSNDPNSLVAIKQISGISHAAHDFYRTCNSWCTCACHQRFVARSPRSLQNVVGFLQFTHAGLPLITPRCTEAQCKQQHGTMRATFIAPNWAVSRALFMCFSALGAPAVSLSTTRAIPADSAIIRLAVAGNIEGIKDLFSRGVASPFDVATTTGRVALHYAIVYRHPELCRFLVDCGSDIGQEDKDGRTAQELAFDRAFATSKHNLMIDQWHATFDRDEYISTKQFPTIHKIVFGLSSVKLNDYLALSSASINVVDSTGRTALSWAAQRGDEAAVHCLIRAGADIELPSFDRQTPLHKAVQATDSPVCIKLLLNAGARADCKDKWQRTTLIYAKDDIRWLKPLVDAKADINAPDCHQRTVLGYAAGVGRPITFRYLLERGGDPYIADNWGFTAFDEAIQSNNCEAMMQLIQYGVRTGRPTKDGYTFLHLAALHADTQMMALLCTINEVHIDVDQIDGRGKTAAQLFEARLHTTTLLQQSFAELLQVMRSFARSSSASENETDVNELSVDEQYETDDEFHDAQS